MLRKPVIGIIGMSDGDPVVHEKSKDVVQHQVDVIVEALKKDGRVAVVTADHLVTSWQSAKKEAESLKNLDEKKVKDLEAQGVSGVSCVDGTILSHGVFAWPNFSEAVSQFGQGPFLLAAQLNPDWPGMVSMLAAGGALHQQGVKHFRAYGDFSDPESEAFSRIIRFAKCAYVVNALKGQKYGLFGGRSLGMYSATVDMQDWAKVFGVDIEHCDQSEIVRQSAEVPQEEIEKGFQWLTDHCADIKYDGKKLTPEKLKMQIAHYEAIKKITKDQGFDFVGVKCHYDMSCHYCTECIAAAFMNDPYDWDGEKEPVAYACEADSDAALTMQILKLLTHDPVVFMDVRHWDDENQVLEFCNCGSQSTWYGAHSDDPAENMKHVTLFPCLDIYAGGGCHVNLQTAPGECTIARLCRSMDEHGKRQYRMVMFTGELVTLPKEREQLTNEEWPHNFVKLDFDYHVFLDNFDANHAHAVYGNHIEELKDICQMLGIGIEILNDRK